MSKSLVSSKPQAVFRRNGITWPFTGIEVDDSEITESMRNDPMLAITPVREKKAKAEKEPAD